METEFQKYDPVKLDEMNGTEGDPFQQPVLRFESINKELIKENYSIDVFDKEQVKRANEAEVGWATAMKLGAGALLSKEDRIKESGRAQQRKWFKQMTFLQRLKSAFTGRL